ncbi:MAG: aminotransferase class V-fold PLP-dependent enzyme [candidate division WOR-3 bacterium]
MASAKSGRASVVERLREALVGINVEVPLLSGQRRRYVNLDNASSTPTFRPIQDKVNEFLEYYSNVHRGTGFKSQVASWVFDEARRAIARFVRADLEHDTVIFTKNTTESLNKLSRLYPFPADAIILTTMMEHSSNELPWRRCGRVVHAGLRPDGSLDLDDFAAKLKENAGRVALVTVTGAANVSGWVNPVHEIARFAHEAGARIVVDAAQLAAHRPIDMKPHDHPEHLDFVAFSAHKMYAPYGAGVLVGDRQSLLRDEPETVGGGTVDLMTLDAAYWRDLPQREEAGTPDVVGIVALAAACRLLEAVGWDAITEHEDALTRYALERLARVPGLRILGKQDGTDLADRLGVIAFSLADFPHALVAAILAYEGGIGVRNGCFCAHPYTLCLLGVPLEQAVRVGEQMRMKDRGNLPGTVRASIGLYNNREDIDALCDCLEMIARREYQGSYTLCRETGSYVPDGVDCFDLAGCFALDPRLP